MESIAYEITLMEQIANELKELTSMEYCPKSSAGFTQWRIKLFDVINVKQFFDLLDWLRYSSPPLDDGEVKAQAKELFDLVNAVTPEESSNYRILGPVDEARNRTSDLAETLLRRVTIAKQRLKPAKPAETEQNATPSKDGKEKDKTIVAIIVSLFIICIFVLSVWLIPFTPFSWLKNHPNSYGLQGSTICLITCFVVGFFKPQRRKWCWGSAAIAFLVGLLSLL